jgi:membrane protein implicated in regulation of membrane protease activity
MALVLLLIIVAIALGIVGAVVHGLFYLLIIGIAVLAVALIYGAMRFRRAGKRPGR